MSFLWHRPNKLLLLFIISMLLLIPICTCESVSTTDCNRSCGNIDIPYPFGTSEGCYLANDTYRRKNFRLTCTDDSKLYWGENVTQTSIQISQFNVSAGHMKVFLSNIGQDCYNASGKSQSVQGGRLTTGTFVVSTTENKFTVVGCDTYGRMGKRQNNMMFYTACTSYCGKVTDVDDGKCDGMGCCQVPIPQNTQSLNSKVFSYNNHSKVLSFNPCGYAFIADTSVYNFSVKHLSLRPSKEERPVVLEWAISNKTCAKAMEDGQTYACSMQNTKCLDVKNGKGYRCNCLDGYQGNPYLPEGCQDINECKASINPCDSNASCENSVGNFSCLCNKGFQGDGFRIGTGCRPKIVSNKSTLLIVVLSVTVGLLALVVAGSWMYWIQRKRKILKLRENFFQQNGGLLLQQKLSQHEASSRDQTTKIFTIEDLKKATNNYGEDRVIGQGGFGTVYKGILSDEKVVAIKKSKISDESQTEQFVNEVIILSQVNHRNVVKLIGCCLETEVPSLVYEFITNGTLSERIHDEDSKFPLLTWEMRLNIAADTAGALAYLHSAASIPIIHRDIKTANILLDDMYTAKVSDFGASKLVPANQTEIATLVQGTFGYLDPEYFFSNQLTEKSDVYSFGVVLVELLTGEKALSYNRPEKHKNLAMHFDCAMKEDRLIEILDKKIVNDDSVEQMKGVARIAKRCLRMIGDERPSMREVTAMLEGLKITQKHPWEEPEPHSEETKLLLDINYNEILGDENGYSESADFISLKDRMMDRIDGGR